jgi:hypothetical protein
MCDKQLQRRVADNVNSGFEAGRTTLFTGATLMPVNRPSSVRTTPKFASQSSKLSDTVVAVKNNVLAPLSVDGMTDSHDSVRLERARALFASVRFAGELSHRSAQGQTPAVEPALELGSEVFVANSTMHPMWNAMSEGQAMANPAALNFNDQTVTKMVASFFSNKLRIDHLTVAEALIPDAAAYLRTFVRAAELGAAVTIDEEMWTQPWPQTLESAALLRRAANAFSVDAATIPFAGETLATALMPPEVAKPAWQPDFELASSLFNFYPSLKVATLLASHPLFAKGAERFVNGLAAPDDIAELVAGAVGTTITRTPSPVEAPELIRDRRLHQTAVVFEGFPIASGPISTNRGNNNYRNQEFDKPSNYFRHWASDDNLKEEREAYAVKWALGDYTSHLESDPEDTRPSDVLTFVARQLELDPYMANHTRNALESNTIDPRFLSAPCVPALLRLAKASSANIDTVRMADRTTSLREAANDFDWGPKPGSATDFEALVKSVVSGESSERLAALDALTGLTSDAPSFSRLMSALLPSVASGLRVLAFDTPHKPKLLSILSREPHPVALAAMAGLFLQPRPGPLSEFANALGHLSPAQQDKVVSLTEALHGLTPQLKAFALQRLAETPPSFDDFEVRLAVATTVGSAQLTTEAIAQLYQASSDQNPSATLRALVEAAYLTGKGANLATFLKSGLLQGTFTREALDFALSGGLNTGVAPEAHDEVLHAMEALEAADPITEGAALEAVTRAVIQHSEFVSPAELIRGGLAALYERDCITVAPLNEVETHLGSVPGAAMGDGRSVTARLGITEAAPLDVFELARTKPALARRLELFKARTELALQGTDADTFVEAAAQASLDWLATETSLSPQLNDSLAAHLSSWALSR